MEEKDRNGAGFERSISEICDLRDFWDHLPFGMMLGPDAQGSTVQRKRVSSVLGRDPDLKPRIAEEGRRSSCAECQTSNVGRQMSTMTKTSASPSRSSICMAE